MSLFDLLFLSYQYIIICRVQEEDFTIMLINAFSHGVVTEDLGNTF